MLSLMLRIQVSANPAAILLLSNGADHGAQPGSSPPAPLRCLLLWAQSSAPPSTCSLSSKDPWDELVWGWERRGNLLSLESQWKSTAGFG